MCLVFVCASGSRFGSLLFSKRGFGISKFIVAAAVDEGADKVGGLSEGPAITNRAVSVKVNVGEKERHGASLGDLLNFSQVLVPDSSSIFE